jgi:hypothetical protein
MFRLARTAIVNLSHTRNGISTTARLSARAPHRPESPVLAVFAARNDNALKLVEIV